ncbi:M16 family metallopeptidase [Singulisphaera acidiphila]|uniref:Putative Zn-dependent peptidase n=1 Tax=Singulisphaera acidiphila (strain ATCC BAA-1392 / DSM 18658 / VKM B-2454 / MOB10) TaxID=886293 RepID=L0D5J4_SINAD|nr:insulinase family protein [Singulisphaera acidiphila]AGA24699.1 putative Zn-dependent peptidase [Singulisphaera acidiphila DSM 18658]
MRLCLGMPLLLLPLACTPLSNGEESGPATKTTVPEWISLENGLTVLIRPVEDAKEIALVVLYKIGGDHDPKGHSGMAHMIEHIAVTAAAGTGQARTAEEFFGRYRSGCNAQTGDRYTVVATVFPKADLKDELREAAARMGDLRLTSADLDRERPRVLAEIANMFGRIPSLSVLNHARELIRPTPQGGRKGGLPEHIAAITREEIQLRYERYYKPRNAILVLAGGIDAATARAAVVESFAKLPPGQEIPPPSEPDTPKFGSLQELAAESPQAQAEACLAYRAPDPASDLYAPFLVLASRLWAGSSKLESEPGRAPIYFPLLDDPAILGVTTRRNRGETSRQTLDRLEAFMAETVEPKLGGNEGASAQQAFGFFLGTTRLPDPLLVTNLYGVAFSLARREQLGIDPARLNRALSTVTDQELRRAAKEFFAPGRHAEAWIKTKN